MIEESQLAALSQAWNEVTHATATFGLRDFADILIVALVSYFVLIFIKQTRSYFILNAIIVLIIVKFASESFNLELTRQLIQPLFATLALVAVVLFQRDIRRFFKWISAGKSFAFFTTAPASSESFHVIVDTIWEMASNKIGAIIIFPGESPLGDSLEGGTYLDGEISRPLILSVFDSNSPGHDGAMLIENNKIRYFGLHLPLADDFELFEKVGTRHRAGIGVTQKTDAMAIIVSEERGEVSVAEEGRIRSIDNKEALLDILHDFIKPPEEETPKSFWYYLVYRNLGTKIASLAIAALLWFVVVYQSGTSAYDFFVPIEFRYVPEEMIIENVSVKEVSVTLLGSNSDLSNLDPKVIRIFVDLSETKEGENELTLSEENLDFPAYLEFGSINPREFTVTLDSE